MDQSALAVIVGYRLRLAQLTIFRDFINDFADMGLRPVDYSVLRLIETNSGVRQGDVASALGIKRANMVSLVHMLEDRGLVERRRVPGDGRAHALHLTAAGKRFVGRMQRRWRALEDRVVARLGGEGDRDTLIALLDRLAPLD